VRFDVTAVLPRNNRSTCSGADCLHPGPEQVVETYYTYALSTSTHLTTDYQFIVNPGYNEDRGPVNVFFGRIHWQF
jgi:carbohydrate-selective porin OprB